MARTGVAREAKPAADANFPVAYTENSQNSLAWPMAEEQSHFAGASPDSHAEILPLPCGECTVKSRKMRLRSQKSLSMAFGLGRMQCCSVNLEASNDSLQASTSALLCETTLR